MFLFIVFYVAISILFKNVAFSPPFLKIKTFAVITKKKNKKFKIKWKTKWKTKLTVQKASCYWAVIVTAKFDSSCEQNREREVLLGCYSRVFSRTRSLRDWARTKGDRLRTKVTVNDLYRSPPPHSFLLKVSVLWPLLRFDSLNFVNLQYTIFKTNFQIKKKSSKNYRTNTQKFWKSTKNNKQIYKMVRNFIF